MTITIPVWVLWTIGACIGLPLVMLIGFFAVAGWLMGGMFGKRGFWG